MQYKRDLAIVLRSIRYEDRHRIVTALTQSHGQITALAKNSIQSRRFGGALELFAASEWLFREKPGAELLQLQETQIRHSYPGLRLELERFSLASAFSEIMLKVSPQHQPCPELFQLHANGLAALEEEPHQSALAILNGYLAKVLQWNGNQPQLQACLSCKTPLDKVETESSASSTDSGQSLTCIVAEAAWICVSCRLSGTKHVRSDHALGGGRFQYSLLRLAPAAMRDFAMSLETPIRSIPRFAETTPKDRSELFQFLEALLVYHVPGFDRNPIKALRFLDLKSSGRLIAKSPL